MAQRKRAGLITLRSLDRNKLMLIVFLDIFNFNFLLFSMRNIHHHVP